jgi:hypothetical protein
VLPPSDTIGEIALLPGWKHVLFEDGRMDYPASGSGFQISGLGYSSIEHSLPVVNPVENER